MVEGETSDTTFAHFVSASVDGRRLVRDTDYSVAEGSVVITLEPAYLEALSTGKHELAATFDDGSATASFVVAEPASEPAPQPAPQPASAAKKAASSSTAKAGLPRTSDLPAPAAALALSGAALAVSGLRGRRRR